ncbi:MAG: hypothetical protein ACPGTO_07485 [Polaribacter sp.]
MTITITKLYQILAEKTDKETAETLTNYIETKVENEVKGKTNILTIKEDLYKIKGSLQLEIHKIKYDMIKCYVTSFIILSLMIAGLYLR